MPTRKLKEFLDRENVRYVTIRHSPAYTMPEIAATAHIPGKQVAKTVMVELDGKMAMVVVPSPDHVDLETLRDQTGASRVALANEKQFEELFPGCELGAMPPFGNLYGLDVFITPDLQRFDRIAFNAGTHTELVELSYRDFERLVEPQVLDVAIHA